MQADGVADGVQALAALCRASQEGRPYALALLDERMPGMDGLAVARALKAEPALASVPLILLASWGEHQSREDIQQAGFAAVLLKPLRQSHVYHSIATVMSPALAPAPPSPVPHPPPVEAPAPARVRVLVAEDNRVNQKVAVHLLEKPRVNPFTLRCWRWY
jgi:CheY-like chemotaxis protein